MTLQPALHDPLFIAFQSALAGRYSIDREVGRGGMGIVYLAREVHLDRWVAIKLLPPTLAARPTLRERFLREARLAAKLSHPNIIPIHAVGETEGFVYYVMAFVDGETLAQRVHMRGPLSASDGSRLLREIAWALAYAHNQRLVHRDVKPDNILIESSTGRALVADFGIAAAAGDADGDGIVGTPEFMSPEQALGKDIDARSDIYSLGVSAFFAMSGCLPFEGTSATEVLAKQVTQPAPPLQTIASAVPRGLAQLIDRCLAKDPARRPATADELADHLGVAIEQRREMPAALRAFVKRNGRMNGGGTLLALFGTLTGAVTLSAFTGPITGVAALVTGLSSLPLIFGIHAAGELLASGFTHADLAPAFRAEQESSREERYVDRPRLRRVAEWLLRSVAGVTATTTAALVPIAMIVDDHTQRNDVAVLASVVGVVAVVSTIGYLASLQLRRDVDVEFWSSAWTNRYGAFAFSVARKLRGNKPTRHAMTHRATELSLGMAAEQLFESLPKATRDALGDVPALLSRLQRDAHALRACHDQLHSAIALSSDMDNTMGIGDARETRDSFRDRLRETVGVMEDIRLSLLRLHAGAISMEKLTTHLDLATEIARDVERLIAANEEVTTLLQDTRRLEPTPV